MKLTEQEHAEVRSAHVDQLTREIFALRRAAVIAGDAVATRDLSNGLLDHLTESGELKGLIVSALNSPPELTGRAFMKALIAVAQRHAEEEAEAQVAAAERHASQDPENFRPRTRRTADALEKMQV
jgi:hypothetical protein